MNRPFWIVLIAVAVAVSACGRVGTLDQPAPLYGAKAKANYEAGKEAAAAAKARKDDSEPANLPRDPRDSDPNVDLLPPRSEPIAGQKPNPSGPPPAGALPDPFNHPQ